MTSSMASGALQDAGGTALAKLEAKWQEREAEKTRRRKNAAEASDPAENAHVFWQVSASTSRAKTRAPPAAGRLTRFWGPPGERLCLTVARGQRAAELQRGQAPGLGLGRTRRGGGARERRHPCASRCGRSAAVPVPSRLQRSARAR